MEENDGNNSLSRTWSSSLVLNSCQSNPCCERTAHAACRREEERSPANAIDEKGETDGFDPVRGADDSIESVLELWIRDANVGEDFTLRLLVTAEVSL